MKTLKISPPNAKQEMFFNSRKRFIGYGGSRGGGKSWALRTKFVLMAFKYSGIKLLLLRKTLPELRENHILPLLQMLNGIAKYKADERAFVFTNGSRLKLGYCDHEKDIFQYQGQEYDVIGIEEATHFTWTMVEFLSTCNRSLRTDIKPRMYFTANPGNVGHKWFKRLFFDKKYIRSEKPEDYEFIPATVEDNAILMERNPEYIQVLDNLPDKLRKAHRFGDWNVFEGQYFEEFTDDESHYFDRKWTHVIEPFEIPPHWKVYRSFDFGYARPFACNWWTMDNDGRLYGICELYGCTGEPNVGVKWEPNKIFAKIREIEEGHRWLQGKHVIGVADPSIWDSSRGESIAQTAEKNRVYFERGDNKRIPGWMQIRYRLAFDENGIPMMYFFKGCKDTIRTLPELIYDERSVEDLDTDGEDHLADSVRYFAMLNPIPPRQTVKQTRLLDDPLNMQPQLYKPYGFMQS